MTFVFLQFKDGQFGPRVSKQVEEELKLCTNLIVTATESGKLTKPALEYWTNSGPLSNVEMHSLLIVDALSTYKSASMPDQVDILLLPGGATPTSQPEDVFFFRPLKNSVHYCNRIIRLKRIECNLHDRLVHFRLQSLALRQFSSPQFRNLILYGWWKSGYLTEKPGQFEVPCDVCFKMLPPVCSSCSNESFIRCAWCQEILCFAQFFTAYHNCYNFIP